MTADAWVAYREQYRQEQSPPAIRAGGTCCSHSASAARPWRGALLQVDQARPLEWLAIPLSFFYTNFAEYWSHRGPMHHLKRGLRLVYERHTRQHHRFFTDQCMELDGLREVACLNVATSLGYFLNYEFLHMAYHLPAWHPVARGPLIGRLRRLHQAHHDPRLMTRYNFNITYPIFDAVFGTLHRPRR